MIGLSILFTVIAYIWLAFFTVKRLPTKKAKYLAIAIFALIPIWDIAPGYLYFKYLCQTKAGETIYRAVENVTGVYQDEGVFDNESLLKGNTPYKFVEIAKNENQKSTLVRSSLDISGNIRAVTLPIEQRESMYSLGRIPRSQQYSGLLGIQIIELKITDIQSNEVIAKKTGFRYGGGWVNRLITSIGTGHPHYETCPEDFFNYLEFISRALIPSK